MSNYTRNLNEEWIMYEHDQHTKHLIEQNFCHQCGLELEPRDSFQQKYKLCSDECLKQHLETKTRKYRFGGEVPDTFGTAREYHHRQEVSHAR